MSTTRLDHLEGLVLQPDGIKSEHMGPLLSTNQHFQVHTNSVGHTALGHLMGRIMGMGMTAQFVPVLFLNMDAEMFGRFFDIGESQVTISVGYSFGLVKTGQRIFYMGGIR